MPWIDLEGAVNVRDLGFREASRRVSRCWRIRHPSATDYEIPPRDVRPYTGSVLLTRHVHKAAVVPLECHRHGRGRPIPVLGHDQVRLAGPRRLLLVLVLAVQKDDDSESCSMLPDSRRSDSMGLLSCAVRGRG